MNHANTKFSGAGHRPLTEREDLVCFSLNKVACFCKKVNNFCIIKSSWPKLVSTRRSTVLRIPVQSGFPVETWNFSIRWVGKFPGGLSSGWRWWRSRWRWVLAGRCGSTSRWGRTTGSSRGRYGRIHISKIEQPFCREKSVCSSKGILYFRY